MGPTNRDQAERGNFMNISCRKCGHADELDIEIVTQARLTEGGTDLDAANDHEHHWDDNCVVLCGHCGHFETLGENKKPLKRRRAVKKVGAR